MEIRNAFLFLKRSHDDSTGTCQEILKNYEALWLRDHYLGIDAFSLESVF